MHLGDISEACQPIGDTEATQQIRQGLTNADKSLGRLKRIADKLGEYHLSLLPPQPELVPLTELVTAEHYKLQKLIDQKQATITIAPSLPSIMADREQLGTIINNVLENALLYSGVETPQISITAVKEGERQCLIIQDNGVGIPEHQLPKIMKPFVRLHAKDAIEGAGLGLWVAATLADKHYMQLTVRNTPAVSAPDANTPNTNKPDATQNRGCQAILCWSP
jgi:light-regulated signal transduction histidine kinase (bacteriophytochrome)